MTAAEKSFIGIAKQTGVGVRNVTDAQFKYLLFRAGGVAPQNIVIPLDAEVGGGAMLRDMAKVGVTSGGALDIIPRPDTMGTMLYGALGQIDSRVEKLDDVLSQEPLLVGGGPAVGVITDPPVPSYLVVTGYPAGAVLDGIVAITGTDELDAPQGPINFQLNESDSIIVEDLFKTVTLVTLPGWNTDGDKIDVGYVDGSYRHLISLPDDQFTAPYWTIRNAPGDLWGESYLDCRVAGYALTFAGARFVEGAVTFIGGTPLPVATATWGALELVDSGPQFLAPTSSPIELPLATPIKVLSGSVAIGLAIPLDEQWVIGSYVPDDFDINQRSMVVSFAVKITDDVLYKKMMYDGVGAAAAWTADLFREGQMKIQLKSATTIGNPAVPYQLDIRGHDTLDNIIWSAAPIGLRAGRQIVMAVTGVVVNSIGDPIECELVNDTVDYIL
ncbi:MAG TPA: hypothetical protein G4O14_02830 [Anaerolineae bacterium]|nr:hypothetical protein [Anaerolineae bacterium]